MIVGVVSDTHGNQEGMLLLAARLKSMGVQTMLHLGDDYQDLDTLARAGFDIFGVPGLYCPEYRNPEIANRQVTELGGLKLLLTHTQARSSYDIPGDLDPEMTCYEVDAVLFGHTHTPALEERQGVAWINPGHLRERNDRGSPPTFALLYIAPSEFKVQIRQLVDGQLLKEKIFRISPQR